MSRTERLRSRSRVRRMSAALSARGAPREPRPEPRSGSAKYRSFQNDALSNSRLKWREAPMRSTTFSDAIFAFPHSNWPSTGSSRVLIESLESAMLRARDPAAAIGRLFSRMSTRPTSLSAAVH